MSEIYDLAGVNALDSINQSIVQRNQGIMDMNDRNRKQYIKDVGDLKNKLKNTDTKFQKVKDSAESLADAGYSAYTGVKVGKGVGADKLTETVGQGIREGLSRIRSGQSVADARRTAFLSEAPIPEFRSARTAQVADSPLERIAQNLTQPKAPVRTTPTTEPDDDTFLRQAEALPDAGLAREGGVELGRTVDAGRGLGMTGTDFPEGLDLPSVAGPTPRVFTRPAFAETAQRAGRQALQTSEGGVLSSLKASQSAVERARGGESFESISGLQDTVINPASRVSAGQGRVIPQSVGVGSAPKEDEVREPEVSEVEAPKPTFELAPPRPIGSVARPTLKARTPFTPTAPTQRTTPAEANPPEAVRGTELGVDSAENAIKSGGDLVKAGKNALGAVGKGLAILNVGQAVDDAGQDILSGKVVGENKNLRASNVLGMVSGGADAVGLGAGSIASGLETAGVVADSTGLGAPLGLAMGIVGAGFGVASAVEDYIGNKKKKQDIQNQLKAKMAQGPTQQTPQALETSTAGEVRQVAKGVSTIS
jgi:hypothetical protein